MLLGYWIDTEVIHWKNGINVAVIGGCCLVLIISSYFSVMEKVDIGFTAGYYSPVMIVFAIALFVLIRNISLNLKPDTETKPKNRIGVGLINLLSRCSFGVYIVHMFWINLAYKFLRINPFVPNALLMMILLWVAVLVLSVLTTMLMKKIPFLNRII